MQELCKKYSHGCSNLSSFSYYLTWILSSLRRHLFHPFWFTQINPYNICHKLFQRPVEKQFQELPPALTTTASVCFGNSFFPTRLPWKKGQHFSLQMKKYRYFKSNHHSLRLANVIGIGCISDGTLMGFCSCGAQVRVTQGVTLGSSQKGKQTHGVTHPQNQINCL